MQTSIVVSNDQNNERSANVVVSQPYNRRFFLKSSACAVTALWMTINNNSKVLATEPENNTAGNTNSTKEKELNGGSDPMQKLQFILNRKPKAVNPGFSYEGLKSGCDAIAGLITSGISSSIYYLQSFVINPIVYNGVGFFTDMGFDMVGKGLKGQEKVKSSLPKLALSLVGEVCDFIGKSDIFKFALPVTMAAVGAWQGIGFLPHDTTLGMVADIFTTGLGSYMVFNSEDILATLKNKK